MSQLEDGNEKVTNSVIPNGTEAKVMRNLIENKGLLNGKGKLYAGTDDTTSTGAPVTTAINPSGVDDGSVLIKDFTKDGGWTVDKIDSKGIKDGAIRAPQLGTELIATGSSSANGITVSLSQGTDKKFNIGVQGDKVVNAQNADKAVNSTYASYASTDTSKGTIEERLTSLGFKEGTLTVPVDAENVSLNYIRKQGNIVTIWFALKGDKDAYPGGSITCTIPSAFVPQSAQAGSQYTFFDFTSRAIGSGSDIYKKYKAQIKITSTENQIIFRSDSTDVPYWSITYDIAQCRPDESIDVRLPVKFQCPVGFSSKTTSIDLTPMLQGRSKVFVVIFNKDGLTGAFSGGSVITNYLSYGIPIGNYETFYYMGDKALLGTKTALFSCQLQKEGAETRLLLQLEKQKLVEDSSAPVGYRYQPDKDSSASVDNASSTDSPFTIVFLPY